MANNNVLSQVEIDGEFKTVSAVAALNGTVDLGALNNTLVQVTLPGGEIKTALAVLNLSTGGQYVKARATNYTDLTTTYPAEDYEIGDKAEVENGENEFTSSKVIFWTAPKYEKPPGIYVVKNDIDVDPANNYWDLFQQQTINSLKSTIFDITTDWATFFAASPTIESGSIINFLGIMYINLTGSVSSNPPGVDTTNWDHAFPQGIITVALKGGDFTNPKDACDSITTSALDNPFYIDVYPGDYMCDPFKIPDHTTLQLNNALLCPSGTGDFIELGENAVIRHGALMCPADNGATIYVDGEFGATADTIRLEGSGDPDSIGFLSRNAGQLTVLQCSCSGLGTAYWANGGGMLMSTASVVGSSIGLRVSNYGQIIGATFASIPGVGTDIQQDDVNSSIRFLSMLINEDQLTIVNWNLIDITYTSDKEDDEKFGVTQEFGVGVPEQGYESVLGEGDSYTRGMLVYTETSGGVFADVSTAARSASGSTVTYPGTGINNAIYFASSLNNITDFIEHYGLKTKLSTARVGGEIVFEYWNGTIWAEVNAMEVDAAESYYPHAKEYFQDTGSHQIRYNSELAADSWTKNDPIVPALGTSYYWLRARIDSALTTAPIFEQFKLHTNRYEINADGWVEYFGKARPQGQLNLDFSVARPFEGNMQSQTIYVNEDVGVGFTQNKFTLSSDKSGISGYLPFDFDTSSPLILEWAGRPTNSQTIEWTIRLDWVTDNGSDVYYLTEPSLSPGRKVVTVTQDIVAGNVSMFRALLDLGEMVSRRGGGFGDELWISMQPTVLSGTFTFTSGQAVYTKWCEGGHV